MIKKVGQFLDSTDKKKKNKRVIKVLADIEKTNPKNYPIPEGQSLIEVLMKLLTAFLSIDKKDMMLPKMKIIMTHAEEEAKRVEQRISQIIKQKQEEAKQMNELKKFVSQFIKQQKNKQQNQDISMQP